MINKKKQNAGKLGRGEGTFKAKKSKKDPELQSRIDEVVRKAKECEAEGENPASSDVIRVDHGIWVTWGTKGARVG